MFEENASNPAVITVPADGQVPLGARTSAGTMMIWVEVPNTHAVGSWRVDYLPVNCDVL